MPAMSMLSPENEATPADAVSVPEVGMAAPLFARIARDQDAQVLGPAAAAGKREGIQIGGIGDFDGHNCLDSHCAPDCEGQTCST